MDFSISPYYDDFESENGAKVNNYNRILFKPGYAVQARELTQIQTILQNQIKSLGDFVLANHSPVHGGQLTFDTSAKAIQLKPEQDGIPITLSNFNYQLIVNSEGAVTKQAKAVAIDDSLESATSAGSLIIKYLSGEQFTNEEVIKISGGTEETATLLAANAVSNCSIVSINPGIFYIDGNFVQVQSQTIVLDSLTTAPSYKVGLQIEEHIINYSSDSSLLDPAQGSFNYQAPGADRYQILLTLTKRPLDSTDTSKFIELLRIENGLITKQIKYPQLGELENTLARRTYDESGDYTVKPFRASVAANTSNTDIFDLKIDPGKAYVRGYEFETIGVVTLPLPKARTQERSENHKIGMEYGNYVITSNVYSGNSGFFDVSNFAEVDLHVVPTANINTTSSASYSNTKVGTARIRDVERAITLSTDAFYTYLLDINTSPVVMNAVNFSIDQNTANIGINVTEYANAYTNVTMQVLAGNSAGEVRTIKSYNPTTGLVTVDVPFTQQIDTNSKLAINFGIRDVDSIVVRPTSWSATAVYGGKDPTKARYSCMDISPRGKDSGGLTKLFLTEYNKLIYPLPHAYIAQSTVSVPSMNNISYISKKNYSSVTFTSSGASAGYFANAIIGTGGSASLQLNESFTYGYTGFVPDSVIGGDIIITVRNKQSSNLANGQVITFNRNLVSNGNGVYQSSDTSLRLDVSSTASFIGDVSVTVSQSNAETVKRTKTKLGTRTSLLTTDAFTQGTQISGAANTNTAYLSAANGILWLTNYNDMVKVPGQKQSLYVPDIIQINGIYDSGSPDLAPSYNSDNITEKYLFNSGQKDNYYDHGFIMLKEGYSPPRGQTAICFTYYNHSLDPGIFNADSYPAGDYANGVIALYDSKSFGNFRLSDSIDLRPTRANGVSANIQTFTLLGSSTGLKLSRPDKAMTVSYGYYLPRIDKLVLNSNKQFKLVEGIPDPAPKIPSDSEDSMSLYVINLPAYSGDPSQVTLKYIENRGYTMKDIGKLDKRIRNIEYYTVLNDLEKRAKEQTVFYQDGAIAKDMYGMVTDNFDDWSVADNSGVLDAICKIGGGTLEPAKIVNPVQFIYSSSTGAHSKNGRTYTLSYTETPCVVQNTVTRGIVVQPFSFGQFKGDLRISPETDYWFSTTIPPVIIGLPAQVYPLTSNGNVIVSVANTTVIANTGGGGAGANTPPYTITLSPTSLSNGTVGTSYSASITASGGVSPYTYTVSSGTLPTGLSLTSGGTLSGTPTTVSTSSFIVKATDANANGAIEGTRSYSMTVVAAIPNITVASSNDPLPDEKAYSVANTTTFTATGGTSPYTYAVTSGTVPTGMSLSSGGVLSGTPTQVVAAHLTVTATDAHGYTGTKDVILNVKAPTISISPSSITAATGGVAYSATITASGGSGGYSYSIIAGSLPTGLSLTTVSNQGVISGTPSGSSGTYTITVRATDSTYQVTADKTYNLALNSPTITVVGPLASATQGSAYNNSSNTVSASGGTAPYSYSVTSGSLPTGLSLGSSTGKISGTPSGTGTSTFTVTATDAGSYTGSASFSIVVAASIPTITVAPTSFTGWTANSAVVASGNTVSASGGTAAYAYTISAGALPAGLSLNSSTGVISGTIASYAAQTVRNPYTFTVTATDANGYIGSRAYSLSVAAPTITLTSPSPLPNGTAETAYFYTLGATGGKEPYTYYFTSGAAPSGISIPNSGIMSGTCVTPGTYTFGITVIDADGYSSSEASRSITLAAPTINIIGALVSGAVAGSAGQGITQVTGTSFLDLVPGTNYVIIFTASGGVAPYTFEVISSPSTVPSGMSFTNNTNNASLVGYPVNGNYTFTIRATDAYGNTGEQAINVSVVTISYSNQGGYAANTTVTTTTGGTSGAGTTYGASTCYIPSGLSYAMGIVLSCQTVPVTVTTTGTIAPTTVTGATTTTATSNTTNTATTATTSGTSITATAGGNCPDPSMLILLDDGTYIAAGDLQVGMKVRTQHESTFEWGDFAIIYKEVVDNQHKLEVVVDAPDGSTKKVIVSSPHRFWVENKAEWVRTESLMAGDIISGCVVNSINDFGYGPVVKIEIESAHTYMLEGLLSHNAKLITGSFSTDLNLNLV